MKEKSLKKIAVFRALQLGDMLCAVPALKALRFGYPNAKISLVGLPWAKDFASRFREYIDNFIEFPGFPGFPEQPYSIRKTALFIHEMQKQSFDLIIQMHGNGMISNYLTSLLNAKHTAGFYTRGGRCPNKKNFLLYNESLSEVDRLLKLLKLLNIPVLTRQLEFPVLDHEKKQIFANPLFKKVTSKPYICIHPGARAIRRRWNLTYFAYVADALAAKGYGIVFTGIEEEVPIIQKIGSLMKRPYVSLAGKLSLGETAVVLQYAKLLITNCTGISHIADALFVPSVIIFRDSDPKRWAPRDHDLHKQILSSNSDNPQFVLSQALQALKHQVTEQMPLSAQQGGVYV